MSFHYYVAPTIKLTYGDQDYAMFANSFNNAIEKSITTEKSAQESQELYMPLESSFLSATDHRFFLYILFFYSNFTKIRVDTVEQVYILVKPILDGFKEIVQNVDMNTPFYYLFQDEQCNITDGVSETELNANVEIFNQVVQKYTEITQRNYAESVAYYKSVYLEIYQNGYYGDDITFQLLYNAVEQDIIQYFIFKIFDIENQGIKSSETSELLDFTPTMVFEKFKNINK